jgi:hypothetical protein
VSVLAVPLSPYLRQRPPGVLSQEASGWWGSTPTGLGERRQLRAQSGSQSLGAENVMLLLMLNAPPVVISSMEARAAALSAVVGNAAW